MSIHFNGLTPGEAERLALLIEECGETIQAATKVLRHGYESCYPGTETTNRMMLEKEIGHVGNAIEMMCVAEELGEDMIEKHLLAKRKTIRQWLHHQDYARLARKVGKP